MHAVNDIAEFLTSRRARVSLEQVGLPTWGPRRVKRLPREEVASLAGVSVDYYKRLERGNASGAPPTRSRPSAGRAAQQRAGPMVLRILESITSPAIVALDLLASWTATSEHASTPAHE